MSTYLITIRRAEFGEESPELAPILHQYGKALLENAIASSNVLGNGGNIPDEREEDDYEPAGITSDDARFSFSGDGEEVEQPSKKAPKRKAFEEADASPKEPEEGSEDDDDMGVAFTVLDFARVLFERILEGSGSESISSSKGKGTAVAELKLISGETMDKDAIVMELAEIRNDLGDIGLETGEHFSLIYRKLRASL